MSNLCVYCGNYHYKSYLCPEKLNAGIDSRELNGLVNNNDEDKLKELGFSFDELDGCWKKELTNGREED